MAIIVKAQPGESTDQIIKKFKKLVLQDQLLTQLKEKEFYKKPAIRKKEKMAELRRRRKHHLKRK
ncbi:MAG: 30S ribosomal protein S21 [Candidatus Beckwithbacteria bacterium GW2011_GWC2_47_9]|uniref:Small ribosomal subunit protein bS21 n=1 Tax=Candidatus Beckwithbacteria bacterium GW2011_GWC2_47_9 TaxID=1618373 RepID=A0A0G1TZ11_9BACT|nr:MAG: 30S ribosomal protein S21 [Candidatus Beckwithbacteria bacterium GW2011_GWC2_47_9]